MYIYIYANFPCHTCWWFQYVSRIFWHSHANIFGMMISNGRHIFSQIRWIPSLSSLSQRQVGTSRYDIGVTTYGALSIRTLTYHSCEIAKHVCCVSCIAMLPKRPHVQWMSYPCFRQILQQTLDIDGTSHEFALTWSRQPPSWLLVFCSECVNDSGACVAKPDYNSMSQQITHLPQSTSSLDVLQLQWSHPNCIFIMFIYIYIYINRYFHIDI